MRCDEDSLSNRWDVLTTWGDGAARDSLLRLLDDFGGCKDEAQTCCDRKMESIVGLTWYCRMAANSTIVH